MSGHTRRRLWRLGTPLAALVAGACLWPTGRGVPGAPVIFPGLSPWSLALDRSGRLYVSGPDPPAHGVGGNNPGAVWRIERCGRVVRVAGSGKTAYSGDGGPALAAGMGCGAIALDAADNLYVMDYYNGRIRKVDRAGIVTTVAGGGRPAAPREGGPAVEARLGRLDLDGIAVDAKGCLVFTKASENRVCRVGDTGILATAAGNGSRRHSGDGGPARLAGVPRPEGIAVAQDGTVYVAEPRSVRKVAPDGTISTLPGIEGAAYDVAGAEYPYYRALAVDRQGRLYVADRRHYRVLRVHRDGTTTTVAGDGSSPSGASLLTFLPVRYSWARAHHGEGGPATDASVDPAALAVGRSGELFILSHDSIRRVDRRGIITTAVASQSRLRW